MDLMRLIQVLEKNAKQAPPKGIYGTPKGQERNKNLHLHEEYSKEQAYNKKNKLQDPILDDYAARYKAEVEKGAAVHDLVVKVAMAVLEKLAMGNTSAKKPVSEMGARTYLSSNNSKGYTNRINTVINPERQAKYNEALKEPIDYGTPTVSNSAVGHKTTGILDSISKLLFGR